MIILLALLAVCLAALLAYSRLKAAEIVRTYPPVGEFVDAGGFRMHAVHVAAEDTDLPPLVFIHGASGNLRDQMAAFRPHLEGRAEMLFVDRPGHGWSERGGAENDTPDGQARAVARVMAAYGIDRAIIVGHSFGGAVAASFALEEPGMTAGLVFLAPATHPWPGGVDWYYHLADTPVAGWLFANTLALPAGLSRIVAGVEYVFAPDPVPDDYIEKTAPHLVLRPEAFRANARDLVNLKPYLIRTAPRYRAIKAPTVIVTGDSDGVVLPEIHSAGLARDIAGAELVEIEGLGHKPDFITPQLGIAAIEKVAGRERDLQALAARIEAMRAGSAPREPSGAPGTAAAAEPL